MFWILFLCDCYGKEKIFVLDFDQFLSISLVGCLCFGLFRCREKQRKEASRLQAVNRKLTAMNKLLMEENDRLQKQVSQLVYENGYFRQHTQSVRKHYICFASLTIYIYKQSLFYPSLSLVFLLVRTGLIFCELLCDFFFLIFFMGYPLVDNACNQRHKL